MSPSSASLSELSSTSGKWFKFSLLLMLLAFMITGVSKFTDRNNMTEEEQLIEQDDWQKANTKDKFDTIVLSKVKENKTMFSAKQSSGNEAMPSYTITLDAATTFASQFSLPELVSRGNFVTLQSMCTMVRWLVGKNSHKGKRMLLKAKCLDWLEQDEARLLVDSQNLSDYDTIFVPEFATKLFIDTILPTLNNDVFIFTGWPRITKQDPRKYEIMLNHTRVLHMFSLSPALSHPKLSGFPLGVMSSPGGSKFRHYAEEFVKVHEPQKHARIFVSHLSLKGKRGFELKGDRAGIPSAPEPLEYADYLQEMHRHEYVLSPNGDHPDCFRHWEAIGLGTVPITMLRSDTYAFMAPAPVVFSTPLPWNVTELERTLPRNITTNRRMIFEEYWYEYAEATVGFQLNWAPTSYWNSIRNRTVVSRR